MAIHMIRCELNPAKGSAYESLAETVKGIGSGWWRCFDSTWLVMTTKTVDEVRDALAPHLQGNDRLMVVAYGGAALAGFNDVHLGWLSENP
jgi:hypothetical protein